MNLYDRNIKISVTYKLNYQYLNGRQPRFRHKKQNKQRDCLNRKPFYFTSLK